ncbi:NADPH-dependent FMN reductase [Streptococcus thoraltensis]|uniref:NADPH-dependent FMN reductase n=1 Tax=Streptococcus thoraltensis TaxID=55085 RepID=UPI00036EA489|nr:NADPH-dependent FMN reductase [Streptococcus thoraltensis]MDY4761548.1 NADPH-dependent FMN reductase [Streptococcus thoraltensis]
MVKRIGIIVGSVREKSYSKSLAKAISGFFPEKIEITTIRIDDLPLFNPDLDQDASLRPGSYERFRREVKAQDALIVISPEYNRTIPAALKNAIEVGSRPMTDISFNGKPTLIITQSAGSMGGFGANHHLRQALVFLNAIAMPQPEVYLSEIHNLIDKEGTILRADTEKFLRMVVKNFLGFAGLF